MTFDSPPRTSAKSAPGHHSSWHVLEATCPSIHMLLLDLRVWHLADIDHLWRGESTAARIRSFFKDRAAFTTRESRRTSRLRVE